MRDVAQREYHCRCSGKLYHDEFQRECGGKSRAQQGLHNGDNHGYAAVEEHQNQNRRYQHRHHAYRSGEHVLGKHAQQEVSGYHGEHEQNSTQIAPDIRLHVQQVPQQHHNHYGHIKNLAQQHQEIRALRLAGLSGQQLLVGLQVGIVLRGDYGAVVDYCLAALYNPAVYGNQRLVVSIQALGLCDIADDIRHQEVAQTGIAQLPAAIVDTGDGVQFTLQRADCSKVARGHLAQYFVLHNPRGSARKPVERRRQRVLYHSARVGMAQQRNHLGIKAVDVLVDECRQPGGIVGGKLVGHGHARHYDAGHGVYADATALIHRYKRLIQAVQCLGDGRRIRMDGYVERRYQFGIIPGSAFLEFVMADAGVRKEIYQQHQHSAGYDCPLQYIVFTVLHLVLFIVFAMRVPRHPLLTD